MLAWAAIAATLLTLPVLATAEASVVKIPNVTRWVRVFSQLEYRLNEAAYKRDRQTLSNLLSDDFEMRIGTMPGNPIPRATWLRQMLTTPKLQSTLEQMAVHAYSNIVIVSYLWTVTTDSPRGKKRHFFIVDTWRRQAGAWKLAVRYAAAAGDKQITIPAGTPPVPKFEKKE